MREKHYYDDKAIQGFRITPACAGKTNGWECIAENKEGSPPRVREKQDPVETNTGASRITPACAGKTAQYNQFLLSNQDHPRVCGKNQVRISKLLEMMGSPPRVREKH